MRGDQRASVKELLVDGDVRYRPNAALLAVSGLDVILDRPQVPLLNALNAKGITTDMSCAGHELENSFPYITLRRADGVGLAALHKIRPYLPGAWIDVSCNLQERDRELSIGVYWLGHPSPEQRGGSDMMTAALCETLYGAAQRAADALQSWVPLAPETPQAELDLVPAACRRLAEVTSSVAAYACLHEHIDWPTWCPDTSRWTLELVPGDAPRVTVQADDLIALAALADKALAGLGHRP